MDIKQLLNEHNARISLGNRWITYDWIEGFTVWEHKPYAKNTKQLITTECEKLAIETLIGNNSIEE